MRIGVVASRAGVSTKTIRYYEAIGVIAPPGRSPSGYRDYDESTLDRLAFVRSAQGVGLTLGEIRGILALRDGGGDPPCGHVLDLLRSRSAELDRRIGELRSLQGELQRLVERAQTLDPAASDPRRICHLIGSA
ncbi:MAG: heavy metal-responsive transcriptional regulator [Acidimicrobiia bacterium]